MSILSIISVCSEYAEYLNLNNEITPRGLKTPYKWTTAFEENPRVGKKELHGSFEKRPFLSFKGVKKDGVAPNSVEHGENLNELKSYVVKKYNPRFLLVLDPDFFIFYNLENLLDKMRNSSLSLVGASYAESATPLFRDVPVGFCMLFDLDKIPHENICFSAGYGDYPDKNYYPDVGYEMYRKIHSGVLGHYETAYPVVRTENPQYEHYVLGIKEMYDVDYENPTNEVGTKIDEYWYGGRFFGLHTRGKLNQNRNKSRERIESQLKIVSELRLSFK